MTNWLKKVFKKTEKKPGDNVDKANENQSLRLALNTCETQNQKLQSEIRRLRNQQDLTTEARSESNLSILLSNIAQPLVQMKAQCHLHEKGVTVKIENMAHLTQQMIQQLEKSGVTLFGVFDESVPFDPTCHRALSTENTFEPGDPVVVQIQGIRIKNQVLLHALVDANDKQHQQGKE